MDPSQNQKKSLKPVYLTLMVLMLLALGIGIILPDAVRGYTVEDLAFPPMETSIEHGQVDIMAKGRGLDRKADYVTWKAYAYSHCAILDMGDIRIAIPRVRKPVTKSWAGRLKIQTDASPVEVEQKKAERVGGKRLWLETRWTEGINKIRFCDVAFEISKSNLRVIPTPPKAKAKRTAETRLKAKARMEAQKETAAKTKIAVRSFAFGKGRILLVVNRQGKIEAGLRIAKDGILHPLTTD